MDKKSVHRAGRANKTASSSGGSREESQTSATYKRPRCRFIKKKNRPKIRGPRAVSTSEVCALLLAMLRDLRVLNLRYGNADFSKDCETVVRRISAEGVKFATIHLPRFFDSLLGFVETGKSVYPGFRKLGRQQYPHFMRGLVAPIYADPTSEQAVQNVKQLYQFCMAFKKLQGPADPTKLRDQLSNFVNVDIELSDVDISLEPVRDIARDAKRIIGTIVEGLNPLDLDQSEDFRPRPGPGATNFPTLHAHRFRPVRWFTQLTDVFDFRQWFMPPFAPMSKWPRYWGANSILGCSRLSRRTQRSTVEQHTPAAVPSSRFKFVPKTFEKMRGICIEDNEMQWFQQALRSGLCRRLESHPLTKGYVNFKSQLINRDLALKGSLNQEWATIDMSDASDRVSLSLVRYLFGTNKPLLAAIEACSSREVELPKGTDKYFIRSMPLKKVAPMGSAICFPIMSLVHYALIRAILDRSSCARLYKRNVYIYGDDIIVHPSCAKAIYDYLPLFGMKINTDKSFSRGLFRESCGCHAYNGVDVTPIRFKTVLHTKSSPEELVTSLRLEEAFHYKGYNNVAGILRGMIQEVARKYGIYNTPIVNTKSPVFGFYRNDGDALLSEFVKHATRRWVGPTFSTWPKQPRIETTFCVWPKKPGIEGRGAPNNYQTWMYERVAVIVDKFDESFAFLSEEDRYLRYLTQHGVWGAKKYDEGVSRNTTFRKVNMLESHLGYRS